MGEATSVHIEDLELSVRSMALLLELGLETVGDLLALPAITAPRLVAAELTELLAEHGLTYDGVWNLPETPPVEEVTGSVAERWQTIETWMEDHAADALSSLRPPASAQAIAEAEKHLSLELPPEYKELLARHDGQEDMGPMVAYCSLIPVAELAEKRQWLAGLMDTWKPQWIPIGHFNRSYMVLDLVGDVAGVAGGIFVCRVDDDSREVIASSCEELLGRYFRELQDGTIDLTL